MGDEEEIELLESQIKGYYHQYLHVITPLIIALEELDEEYPVEILNEIRAIQTCDNGLLQIFVFIVSFSR